LQINKLEANIKLKDTINQNSASPSFKEEEQKWTPVVGNLVGSVFMLKLMHGKEEKLENVDVQLDGHNLTLNGAASNDGTP
jgi:hypothetical protein